MTSSQMPLAGGEPEHRWWILAVLATAQLMVALDATVVSIALPHAQATPHFSSADRQWIVTAYALAFGSLLLLGGRLADIFERNRLFLAGVTGFAAASAAGGVSQSFAMPVTARGPRGICSGVGTGGPVAANDDVLASGRSVAEIATDGTPACVELKGAS